jgi:hypothetical protein
LYHSYACFLYELEEYGNAINYAEKVLSMEPDNKDAKEIIYDCREVMEGSWG